MESDYTCPVCEQKFPRDMILFLRHVKVEIVDKIKEKDPNWTSEQGICPDCKSYYESWFDKIR